MLDRKIKSKAHIMPIEKHNIKLAHSVTVCEGYSCGIHIVFVSLDEKKLYMCNIRDDFAW